MSEIKIPTVEEIMSANPWLTNDKNNVNYYYHQAIIKNMRSKRRAKRASMRNFGSFTNYLMAGEGSRDFPTKGMGATIYYWSDREACFVSYVDPKNLIVGYKHIKCKYVGGGYGDESYEYKDENGNWLVDPNAPTSYCKFKLGKWWNYFPSTRKYNGVLHIGFGVADKYRDPSF